MLQSSISKLAVELPRQLACAPSICRTIELTPVDEQISAPAARIAIAKIQSTNPSHRSQSSACRYLLRHLLSLTTNSKENGWKLHHSSSGAPRLSSNGMPSPFSVSMAHSAQWIAASLAYKVRIGVDVERLRPRGNFLAMADYLEWEVPIRDILDFHEKWTLWEASVKCAETSVLVINNSSFSDFCKINIRNKVKTIGRWSGLGACLENELYYSVVLQCENEVAMTHRVLEPGKIEPW